GSPMAAQCGRVNLVFPYEKGSHVDRYTSVSKTVCFRDWQYFCSAPCPAGVHGRFLNSGGRQRRIRRRRGSSAGEGGRGWVQEISGGGRMRLLIALTLAAAGFVIFARLLLTPPRPGPEQRVVRMLSLLPGGASVDLVREVSREPCAGEALTSLARAG